MSELKPLFEYGPHKGKARCQTWVSHPRATLGQCTRRATIGSTCKQHSPQAKAARDEQRDETYRVARQAQDRMWERGQAGRDALRAIHLHLNGRNTNAPSLMHAALMKYINNGGTLTALEPEA